MDSHVPEGRAQGGDRAPVAGAMLANMAATGSAGDGTGPASSGAAAPSARSIAAWSRHARRRSSRRRLPADAGGGAARDAAGGTQSPLRAPAPPPRPADQHATALRPPGAAGVDRIAVVRHARAARAVRRGRRPGGAIRRVALNFGPDALADPDRLGARQRLAADREPFSVEILKEVRARGGVRRLRAARRADRPALAARRRWDGARRQHRRLRPVLCVSRRGRGDGEPATSRRSGGMWIAGSCPPRWGFC